LKPLESCPSSLELIKEHYKTAKLSDLKNDYERLLAHELPEI